MNLIKWCTGLQMILFIIWRISPLHVPSIILSNILFTIFLKNKNFLKCKNHCNFSIFKAVQQKTDKVIPPYSNRVIFNDIMIFFSN